MEKETNTETKGKRTDLLSLTKEELCEVLSEYGQPKYRATQIFTQLSRGVTVAEMTNLPRALRETLAEDCIDTLPRVEKKLVSRIDGTVKYLFSLHDGECIESVLMRYKHGNTLCISSQVGCRMGCAFCASTIGGKVRDLLPSEMLGQIIAAQLDTGERVSNVVMMGIGEPLDNFENVKKFLRLVNCEQGLNIGYRHISLSTCGVADRIYDLAQEELPITLSISLHESDNEKRSSLMPINKKYPLPTLMRACVDYYKTTKRRISFEYTLISGKNDSEDDAKRLGELLISSFRGTGAPLHVNLIRVNEVEGKPFVRGQRESVQHFAECLEKMGIVATVRRRLGSDVNAACGQLRRSTSKDEGATTAE